MIPMLFHSASVSYTQLVFVILDVIRDYERSHTQRPEPPVDGRCIYCLRTDGDLGPEEHVIPESLGGDEIVLTGCVCASCNNGLSALDAVLLDFEPIAMLRTIHGPMTKKGRFPWVSLRDLDIEKTAPRHIKVTEKSGRRVTTREDLPDGTVRLSMQMTGRKPFDPVLLARALYKIGLGLVAHDAGTEAALAPRYDLARHFIRGEVSVSSHLLIPTTSKPHRSISTWWQPADEHTNVVLDIFGVVFVFDLDGNEIPLPPEVPAEVISRFWLGAPTEEAAAAPNG
jgi:hypothetical protein